MDARSVSSGITEDRSSHRSEIICNLSDSVRVLTILKNLFPQIETLLKAFRTPTCALGWISCPLFLTEVALNQESVPASFS
jgi:hypothetical protein